MAMDTHDRASAVDELESMPVYDRADLERHLAAIHAEADRVRSSIAEAEARRDDLDAARPLSEEEQIGAIMVEAQLQLTSEWEACRRFGVALEEATEALAERILAEGSELTASLRTIVAEMGGRRAAVPADGEPWWNGVIDLTQEDQAEGAPIS